MVREILVYPDKRLKTISKEVTSFDEELHTLLDDMYDTTKAQIGLGLAAIQIGVPKRVFILTIPEGDSEEMVSREETLEIINPVFTLLEGKVKKQEGCLSVPGYYENIERFSHAIVEYQDRHGEKHTIDNDEFLAIALQHENDHLDGKIFVEKLSILKRKKFEKKWKKKFK